MTENTAQPTPSQSRFRSSRAAILLTGVVVIFFVTYLLAWWDAYHLSRTYISHANTSYNEGRYLDALRGYEEYDRAEKKYIHYGGYIQVQRIWNNKYAVPTPSHVQRADARIDEIINEQLTTADAESFVQENIGRSNPYMSVIYLRLGELYEIDGQLRDAEDIYASFPDLFPNDQALIDRAIANLENLQKKQAGG